MGGVTFLIVTVVLLVIAASTSVLDDQLGIGRHRSGPSSIAVARSNGSDRRTLVPALNMGHWGPTWSRDGRRLVYTLGNPQTNVGQLVVTDSHGRGPTFVTHDRLNNYLAAWSPDGKQIAYIAQHGQDTSTGDLAVIHVDGSNRRLLTHNHAWEYGSSWSPDGKRIAYGSEQGGSWHVWIMNADGTGAHVVPGTDRGNAPDWSPDGRTLAFTSDRTGNDNIYAVPVAGGTARRLTVSQCHSDNARWSPDGRAFVFARFCDGWNDIEVMNADGSHVRNVTTTADLEEEVPSWLRDGRHVGFTVFTVQRDSLSLGATVRIILFGLLLGLLVAGATQLTGQLRRG